MRLNSLLVKTAISLMSISVAFPALADTRSNIIVKLQNNTNIPVKFPVNLPNTGGEKIYLNWSADNNSYNVNFDYTSDCGGATACNMGSFSANRGAQIQSKSYYSEDEYQYIKLNNGYSAIFINTCGASCSALVEWKVNGVVYSVYLKNGTKEEIMKIANSVYN